MKISRPAAARTRTVDRTPYLLWAALLVVLAACSIRPTPAPPPAVCQSSGTGVSYTLPQEGAPPELRAGVAALIFSPQGSSLLGVFSPESSGVEGQLVEVNPKTGERMRSAALGPLNFGLVRLSRNAAIVASAFDGQFRLWDTASGDQVSLTGPGGIETSAFAVSSDGGWFVDGNNGVGVSRANEDRGLYGYSFGGLTLSHRVVALAIDAPGRYVAFGLKTKDELSHETFGEVGVLTWNGQELAWPVVVNLGFTQMVSMERRLDQIPLGFAFDPTSQRLAVQTETEITTRTLPTLSSEQEPVVLPKATRSALAFNPAGALLAVGHGEGLTVLHVPDLKTVRMVKGAAVSAVAFSPDGCLLAWGDIEGAVHITGAPEP